LAVANIGDSRVYLLRDGELTQLTDDHSLPQELLRQGRLTAEQAAIDPRRNIVTRVIGASYGEGPDIQNIIPYTGDRLLLCSDGLTDEVADPDIAKILRDEPEPRDAADHLVAQALANGGSDNVSVVIIDVVDDDGRSQRASTALGAAGDDTGSSRRRSSSLMTADERNAELRSLSREDEVQSARALDAGWAPGSVPDEHELPARRVTARLVAFIIVLVLLLGGAVGAIGFYARGAYFVGIDHDRGQVAIFKGRPGGLLWFKPTVEERTDLTQAIVPEAEAADVETGHPATSLAAARQYVANLKAAANPIVTGDGATPAPTTAPSTVPATPTASSTP